VIKRLSLIISLPVLVLLTSFFLVLNMPHFYAISPYPEAALEICSFVMGGRMCLPLTDSELSHLTDVRELVTTFKFVWLGSLIVFISALSAYPARKRWPVLLLPEIITISAGFILLVLSIPFCYTFEKFHMVFFEPGTYVFPESSLLIQVFPTEFFLATFVIIIGISFAAAATMLTLTILSRRKAAAHL
jgi:integral membrane protein (TIGR01906 family)